MPQSVNSRKTRIVRNMVLILQGTELARQDHQEWNADATECGH
jgi:hypothetical protein